ncbi:LapA family protein [Shewanella sp. 6_MG-2023]|uniref:LapA family protein n=1 Tax=Shewanella sp. 6_MG-2023 TaxID=3062660 RepID=UPI0026E230C6|nr:lipopolysaccharide assembly protein LapA domain-containing protein [Shewanella sp. 6_MG-2023]MDO6620105.1 lipopolysaccharide assembly protein LapA domain-containing protein [Shewanella sp. 6_MG-2023]
MKSFIAIVIVGLFFVLALLFGAKNEQIVTVSYFIAEGQYRLPVVLAIVFFSGFVISWLFAAYYILKFKIILRKNKKQIAQLTEQLLEQQSQPMSQDTVA